MGATRLPVSSTSTDDESESALVLLKALECQPAVAPRRSRGHRHRHEGRLRDLRVGGAGERGLLGVGLDAPRTLRDLRDAQRDELLGLAGNRAVLERLLIELEEGPIGFRYQLAHPLELRAHVDAVKFHGSLLDLWPRTTAPAGGPAQRPRKTGLRFSRHAW